jgi:ketosteroid isomerase-like protein
MYVLKRLISVFLFTMMASSMACSEAQDDMQTATDESALTTVPTPIDIAVAVRNKAIVQKLYERFLAGDLPAVLAMHSQDAKWWFQWQTLPGETQPFPWVGNVVTGPAAIGNFLTGYMAKAAYLSFVPQVYVADGDRVFVQVNVSIQNAQDPSRKVSFRKLETWLIDRKTGKITEHSCFLDTRALDNILN